MFKLVHLYLYTTGYKGPLLDVCFPQEDDEILSVFVERELKNKRPNTAIVIGRDLKSAKNESGSDVVRLFDLPISNFFSVTGGDKPKGFHVVLKPPPMKPEPRQ